MGYGRDIYEKAEAELGARRRQAFTEMEKRRAVIFEQLPEVRELETRLTKTGVSAAKAVFGGGDAKTELEKLRVENLKIQNEMRVLLGTKGYLPADLEERYTCRKCRDKGYIDGKMCDCMKRLLRDIAYNEFNSRSPLSLENSRFENFRLDYYPDTSDGSGVNPRRRMERTFDFCKKYADEFTPSSLSILMEGGTGLGKTHLSLAIAGRVIDRGFGVIYGSAPDILSALETEHFSSGSDRSVSDRFEKCDLLIIDDLGTEFQTTFTKAAMYNLINARLVRGKPTIINTNMTMSDLKRTYSDRLASRLVGEHHYMQFVGEDVRIMRRRMEKNSE